MSVADQPDALKHTALYDAHVALGARMVPFAGYEMPVQYPDGTLKEHGWTREQASLFDVSHMGQAYLIARDGRHETAAAALEALTPSDILGLEPGRQRYTQLLNNGGGVIDDLMVARPADAPGVLALVLNASRKDIDRAFIANRLAAGVRLDMRTGQALLALQGPTAAEYLAPNCPEASALAFMQSADARIGGIACHVSRAGYTGEDGFEISVAADRAGRLWQMLLGAGDVRPAGLGARDTLRLEAGLCLYGHELDETTSPVEAGLAWSIPARRRIEGGFPGAARIQAELAKGPKRLRVGLAPEGRTPAREGAAILSPEGEKIGVVTSGGYGPSLGRPIAMGYVAAAHARIGAPVRLLVRDKTIEAKIAKLPFAPHRYRRAL